MKNIEIHKCNFLEVINRFENKDQRELKGTHRRTGSQSKKPKDPTPKNNKEKEDLLFFILDKETHKTYLIKSPDNMIIGSLVHFYLLKENPQKVEAQSILPFLGSDPEYSGVIEVAICKKKCISKYHSSLKSYTFKKQFLIIKHGKFNIYEMKTKDSLNLIEYEVKIHNSYDLIPQTNPYVFSLSKLEGYDPYTFVQTRSRNNLGSLHENDLPPMFPERKKPMSFMGQREQVNFNTSPHYEDLVIVEEKKSNGFFSSFFKKFNFSKKKIEQVILSCDTELKRRQWVLTINFFTQLAMKNLHRSKMSYTKESILNTNEDAMLKSSFGGDLNSINDSENKKRYKSKNKNSISIKHKVAHNPDYVDVFRNENQEQEDNPIEPDDIKLTSGGNNNKKEKALPLITEPDASRHLGTKFSLLL